MSNALKFTLKGEVRLSVNLTKSSDNALEINFKVSDSGIGISKEKQATIFESFTQAYADTTRNFGGTGLGLAISLRLVKLQNGEISVKSELGEGSTFSFYLPFLLASDKSQDEKSRPEIIPNEGDLKGLEILVAEDNKINQLLMKQVIKRWDAIISIASDGEEALESSLTKTFDVILMDLQMPKKNGITAATEITANVNNPNRKTPIIALTADALVETRELVKTLKFAGYVTKPFKSNDLYEEIMRAIAPKNNAE
jgi:CheY-like chemotaxis protein